MVVVTHFQSAVFVEYDIKLNENTESTSSARSNITFDRELMHTVTWILSQLLGMLRLKHILF